MNDQSIDEPDRGTRSPWSRYNETQEVLILPAAGPVDAAIRVPGSKSLTNRALIMAALAEGTSRLEGLLKSDDSYWCVDSLRRLGVGIDVSDDTAVVEGAGGQWPVPHGALYVGAAGTVARFLPGALLAGSGEWSVSGGRRLSERPLAPLLEALARLGADIRCEREAGCLPLTVRASGGLPGGETAISGAVSSQFLSGLLIAAPYAKAPVTIRVEGGVVQRDYVEMTLDMMRRFGVRPEVRDEGRSFVVVPGRYQPGEYRLEPDVSTCCYYWALAALTNGRIRIDGISAETRQPDIEMLDILERMGCAVTKSADFVEVQGTPKPKGGFTVSMKRWSDQTLTMAALACFADGPVTLTDAAHIRHHECDRIAAICTELRKLGIRVEEREDGLTVHPGQPRPALLDPQDDHRMAMSLALIGAKAGGVRIADPSCVAKTCPDYFDQLAALGVNVQFG
ncbi:3-phosphoshikimate 1-carboxyvinyltransferase [Paenibacillus hamazuiensis]|uniref:3-phosphoshikimate 1-carboxyvinyltransferase n=1 Tax=Paenibacillus hamazuiensis TaxID=2936508 RepID=UPI00200E83B0|nr:3-phosphoshikimate 1-carboxyvinyltransferase [Paenibacillus hamazuiensis]